MKKTLAVSFVSLLLLGPVNTAWAQDDTDDQYDFSLPVKWFRQLAESNSILPTWNLHLGEHSNVHALASDCEMHIAATPLGGISLGDPGGLVVEPPNLCLEKLESMPHLGMWPKYIDEHARNVDCQVTGFPRIFTEHASSGGGASNPNHVLELHPALSMSCGDTVINFAGFLKAFPGMRSIKDSTTAACLGARKLEVRQQEGIYEFRQSGGGSCGNFATLTIGLYRKQWVHAINGGHSAIVRGFAGNEGPFPLKVYTMSGTEADQILSDAMAGKKLGEIRVIGVLTYDYFNIRRALRSSDGHWAAPTKWTTVKFPISAVLMGELPPGGDSDDDGDD